MSRLFVAALVLLASIGGLLGAASWNRGGTPQVIVLTERELGLLPSFVPGRNGDAGPIRLAFRWHPRDDPQESRLWLNDLTLRNLGFNTGLPAGAPDAKWFYGRSLPRVAWVAFEYDGPAWRTIERRGQTMGGGVRGPERAPSRLVPVDAAPDLDALRRRYAGAPVVMLPAILELRYATTPRQGPSVWGRVQRLVSPDVSVPFRLRERLRGLPPPTGTTPAAPRYEVELAVGRLGAVWVREVALY